MQLQQEQLRVPLPLTLGKGKHQYEQGDYLSIDDIFTARQTDGNDILPVQLENTDGTPHNLSGATIGFRGYDANGNTVNVQGTTKIVDSTNGIVDIVFPTGLFAVPGLYSFFIWVNDGSGQQSTIDLTFNVKDDHLYLAIDFKPYQDDWDKFIQSCLNNVDYKQYKADVTTLNGQVGMISASMADYNDQLKTNKSLIDQGLAIAKSDYTADQQTINQQLKDLSTNLKSDHDYFHGTDQVAVPLIGNSFSGSLYVVKTGRTIAFNGELVATADIAGGTAIATMPAITQTAWKYMIVVINSGQLGVVVLADKQQITLNTAIKNGDRVRFTTANFVEEHL